MTEQTITLTADELAALKELKAAWEQSTFMDVVANKVNNTDTIAGDLEDKGLVEINFNGNLDWQVRLTALGKRLLEAAPAADGRPDVITAKEFVSEGYAAKIAAGECVVICHASDEVTGVNLYGGGWGILHFKWHDESGVGHFDSVTCKPTDTFGVEWLTQPEAAQPVPESGAGEAVAVNWRIDQSLLVTIQSHILNRRILSAIKALRTKYPSVDIPEARDFCHQVQQSLEEDGSTEVVTMTRKDYNDLQTALATAKAENARLREALAFYAVERNYETYYKNDQGDDYASDVERDEGEIARRALDGAKTEGG